MQIHRNPLCNAIKHGFCGALALGLASTPLAVHAQDETEEDAVELDRVQVTGSRIKRTDVEGALPVTVIDRDMIEMSGESSAADMLRNMTFNSFGSTRPAIRQFLAGRCGNRFTRSWPLAYPGAD